MKEPSTDWAKAVTKHRIYRQNGGYPEATSKTIYFAPAVL